MISQAHTARRATRALAVALATALLTACAVPAAGPALPHYHCEHGISFTVRFADDMAVIDTARGREVLYRDAGGVTPSQTVYTNARLRAEFGLGPSGREALLRYPVQPLLARCARG